MEAIHRRARAQAQHERFFRRHRAFGLAQPFAVRRAATGAHVFGERGQLGEILFHPRRDEVAGALTPHQQAFVHQSFDRLAHRDARDRKFFRQLPRGVAQTGSGVVHLLHADLEGLRAALAGQERFKQRVAAATRESPE